MKVFLKVLFIFSAIFHNNVFAQSIEFETIRSLETPGFFLVKIFPSSTNEPLEIQNVFVKNFPEKENETWAEILTILNDFEGKIIDKKDFENIKTSATNRIIFLGEPYENYLNFSPQDPSKIFEEFETFTSENLGPIFFQNLSVEFGGNISEVFPNKIDFLGENGAVFVGKFERPMKTRILIRTTSKTGEIEAFSAIDLNDGTLAKHPLAISLPKIWEEFWSVENRKANEDFDKRWFFIFPWILGGIGILFIIIAFKGRKEKTINEILDRKNLNSLPTFENNPPFEVEEHLKN
jgi:hypothetical protein